MMGFVPNRVLTAYQIDQPEIVVSMSLMFQGFCCFILILPQGYVKLAIGQAPL